MAIVTGTALESNKNFRVNFDGGNLSSDGGLLLLKEFYHKLGVKALLKKHFHTTDSASFRIHKDHENLLQMLYEIPTAKKMLNVVKGDPVEPAVYLGLFLGLRRSEVVGLRWKDVDMENGIVHIRNTVVQFQTLSELEQTKSRASKRDLFMPGALKAYLQKLREKQAADRKLTGRKYSEDEHLCQWPDGTTYKPDYVSRRFEKVLKHNKLPKIRFHDLRHTAGSMLVNSGHTIKQVQEFLGHEKASTTLDIYTHVSLEGKKNTAQVLDELLA